MTQQNSSSYFILAQGKWVFNNGEPLWFKIIIYLLTILFFLGIAWILQEWVLSVIAFNGLSSMVKEFPFFKRKE
jgi:hypothetical protein